MRLVKDMSLSREDFLRLLPAALDARPFTVDGDRVSVPALAEIMLEPLPPLSFPGLSLPRLRVVMEVADAGFLDRFEMAFRRGGG